MPLHANKQSVAQVLGRAADYVKNPEKTNNGEFISTYECDPLIADQEFQFSKREYERITGRTQKSNTILAYHLRQSFKPGEVDPATANKIGYELAMRLTGGNNAFLVCTHVDKSHVHSHIIIDSVNLDRMKKFRNGKKSSYLIRKISDELCHEYGLSVIENPQQSKEHYGSWKKSQKPPEKLNQIIDIEQKMQDGKGAGYEQWAKIHNLKTAAKTLSFLQENNLTELDKLDEQATAAEKIFSDLQEQINQKNNRMTEIKTLQKHIGSYGKTKKIYSEYVKSGYDKNFFAENKNDINLHTAAKEFFNSLGSEKIPAMQSLKQEYAMLWSERNTLYNGLAQAKKDMQNLVTAKANADKFFGQPKAQTAKKKYTHDR